MSHNSSTANAVLRQMHNWKPVDYPKESQEMVVSPPPKSLLLYLVRMGSFTSTPKMANDDHQDEDVGLGMASTDGVATTPQALIARCHKELAEFPELLKRRFHTVSDVGNAVDGTSFRVFQWNVLSQALGVRNDNFIACPKEALEWKTRRFRMLEEMLTYSPDFLCLQEVDHYNFLQMTLGLIGFRGTFFPKPDSPCIYIQGNNGPDGCAIFFNSARFELLRVDTRVMEVWHVQSNQVAVLAVFRCLQTGREVCLVTTHLKARQGTLLSTLRNEQGKDLLEFVRQYSGGRPVVVCGDFNAEPEEPVYATMLRNEALRLSSAYTLLGGEEGRTDGTPSEPPFTTWKIREDGEACHTIDYIFYSRDRLEVTRLLQFPTEEEVGENRLPSLQYPSDHFSLVADFRLKEVD